MINTKKLYLFNFCFGALNSVAIQMLPLILFEKGFDYNQVAILLGVVFLSALFQPFLGILNKKYLGDVSTLKIIVIGLIISSIIMYFSNLFGMMLILILFFSLVRLAFSPINDSYLTKHVVKYNINYGLVRSGASLGFGTGMIIFTIISQILNTDYNSGFIYIAIVSIIAFGILTKFPKDQKENLKEEIEHIPNNTTNLMMYALLVIMYALYFGGLGIRISYLSSYYVEFGYTTLFISITTFVMIIPEITIMPLYNKIFGNFSKSKLIAASITLGIIQMFLYIFFHEYPVLLIITSFLNGLQIMIFFPSFFMLLQRSLGKDSASLGFLLNMTIQSIFVGVFSLIIIRPLYTSFQSTIPIFFSVVLLMILSYIPLGIYHFKYSKS